MPNGYNVIAAMRHAGVSAGEGETAAGAIDGERVTPIAAAHTKIAAGVTKQGVAAFVDR